MCTQWWVWEPKVSRFGPQIGIACAFKSDLRGKAAESNGTLLPMHGILLFSKENEHPRVDLGAQREAVTQRILDRPSVFPKEN